MERGGRLSYLVLRHHRWRTATTTTRTNPFPAARMSTTFQPSPPTADVLLLKDEVSVVAGRRAPLVRFRAHYLTPAAPSPLLVRLNVEFSPTTSSYRSVHTTAAFRSSNDAKPSSKIEETVNRLKQKQLELTQQAKDLAKTATSAAADVVEKKKEELVKSLPSTHTAAASAAAPVTPGEVKALEKPKKTLWVRVVDEVKHYYSGFKLLFLDVRICSKIVWKVLHGDTLTRRENKQLVRTVSDLFRLLPFSVFIIVPFMELLLPVALKLFPGMLPSTFTTMTEREQKMKRALKAKLEYAKFLQKTLDDMGPSSSEDRNSQSASDFVKFYKEVKGKGSQVVQNKDILKFSKLFKDEITLDNMERRQLVALCRLLELTPMGTNNFLIFQLEMKLRQLKIDDKVIQREGVENMDVSELQMACKERGMRALGMPEKQLQRQLSQWLDLSLNENVPPSLLLLSRTLYLPEDLAPTAQIAATISTLPQSAATHTSASIGEQEGKIRNVTRLEIIKEEQRKIEEEAKELALHKEAERKRAVEAAQPEIEAKAARDLEVLEKHLAQTTGRAKKVTVSKEGELQEEFVGKVPILNEIEMVEELSKSLSHKKPEEISTKDLSDLKSAILSLGKAETDETEIMGLKKELKDYEEDLEELKFMKAEAGRFDLQESKGAKRLFAKVNQMLSRVDSHVGSLQEKEKAIAAKIREKRQQKDEKKAAEEENLVSVHELIDAVQKLQKTSDSSKVEQIAHVLSRMDEDADGIIKVDDVMKVIELLGREHVKLSEKAIDQIVDMIAKEEMLAVEADIEEVLGKSLPDHGSTAAAAGSDDDGGASRKNSGSNGDDKPLPPTMSRKDDDDIAKDLTEQVPEKHIQEMFGEKPTKEAAKVKASDHEKKNGPMNLK